jgi:hypothetical protein
LAKTSTVTKSHGSVRDAEGTTNAPLSPFVILWTAPEGLDLPPVDMRIGISPSYNWKRMGSAVLHTSLSGFNTGISQVCLEFPSKH